MHFVEFIRPNFPALPIKIILVAIYILKRYKEKMATHTTQAEKTILNSVN